MRPLCLFGLCLLLAACAQQPNRDFRTQTAQEYLAGGWLLDPVDGSDKTETPPDGAKLCVDHLDYSQYEFEFQHSGGLLTDYEPPDLYSFAVIRDVTRSGDDLVVHLVGTDQTMKWRILSANSMASIREDGRLREPIYRCAPTPSPIQPGVSDEWLRFLTFAPNGTPALVGCENEVCNPKKTKNENWLLFDLLGPNHFYLFGRVTPGWHDISLDQLPIQSISMPNEKTLVLEFRERSRDAGGWNGDPRRPLLTLTLIRDGDTVFIPEMQKTFRRIVQPFRQ
jgi:hypothetical protein